MTVKLSDAIYGTMIMVVVIALSASAGLTMLTLSGMDTTTASAQYSTQYGALIQDANNISNRVSKIQQKVEEVQYNPASFVPGGEAIVETVTLVPDAVNLVAHAIGAVASTVPLPAEAVGIILAVAVIGIILAVVQFLRGGGQL